MGQTPLVEQQIFQRDFGRNTVAVAACRRYIRETYNAAVDAIAAGEGPEIVEQRLRESKAVASFVVESCRDVVTSCWRASGSAGIRNPSALQRCFRDISVGAGHQAFDERNYVEFAKSLLGLEPSPF
jgi:alkylation response protein AidB-like acyl-CoA dehydrogenase